MHTHTLASTHAYSTITENAQWASEHGIKYLGMTDHGVDMQDSPDTWHFENLKILPDFLEGVRIFKGIEANIMDTDGSIDIPKSLLCIGDTKIVPPAGQLLVQPLYLLVHTDTYVQVRLQAQPLAQIHRRGLQTASAVSQVR
mgnify:CR=1 FL=1